MATSTKTTHTWTCERCATSKDTARDSKPSTASDPWGYLKIDQDAGWESETICWRPRMRAPVLLCGKCMDEVVAVVNQRPAPQDGGSE